MVGWASQAARDIRAEVFGTFASEGRPPSPDELAERLRTGHGKILAGLRELHDAHAIVLTAEGDAIRMAHPFSAWPMNFVVRAPRTIGCGGAGVRGTALASWPLSASGWISTPAARDAGRGCITS